MYFLHTIVVTHPNLLLVLFKVPAVRSYALLYSVCDSPHNFPNELKSDKELIRKVVRAVTDRVQQYIAADGWHFEQNNR